MKNHRLMLPLLFITALLGACSSMPKTTALLDQARYDYAQAEREPNVGTYAVMELRQAGESLQQANQAAINDDSVGKIDQLAYVARQKVAYAQEVAKRRAAEASIANSGRERDQVLLQQRAQENAQVRMVAQDAQARNAQLEAQLSDLRAKQTPRGIVITFGDVLFGTDQSNLNAEGARTAQKLAQVLQQNPQRSVLIEGFTDSTGSTAHNQALSERRADAVRMTLADMGVARERIAVRGYGEEFPVADNNNGQNRQLNRRVEIVLSDENGRVGPR